ncbi:MAG: class I SAM-dependent methyltransferase [Candidatus Pacebacteria bacterium]|nr:class I SAM-dependent methyltransferase [Candidatus Paceibacterota bacterium]
MPISFITKSSRGKIDSKQPHKSSLFARFLHTVMTLKAKESYDHIKPFIKKSDRILDVGLGAGTLASYLKNKRYNVSSVDVVNLSLYKDVQPTIYNGKKLPYKDNEFDVALIISVLHHCGRKKENFTVLKEAMRVSKKVVLIEDSYRNEFERKIVSAVDQVANWEFWRHKYLTNREWFAFINKNNWRAKFAKQYTQTAFGIMYTHYCLFVLEKLT